MTNDRTNRQWPEPSCWYYLRFLDPKNSEALIDPNETMMMGQPIGQADLGVSTWNGDEWQIGGGTTWGWYTYDPDLDLIILRHRQSGDLESGTARAERRTRRQQMVDDHLRP